MKIEVVVNRKDYVNGDGTGNYWGEIRKEGEYVTASFSDIEAAQRFFESYICGYDDCFNGTTCFENNKVVFQTHEKDKTTVFTVYMRLNRNQELYEGE